MVRHGSPCLASFHHFKLPNCWLRYSAALHFSTHRIRYRGLEIPTYCKYYEGRKYYWSFVLCFKTQCYRCKYCYCANNGQCVNQHGNNQLAVPYRGLTEKGLTNGWCYPCTVHFSLAILILPMLKYLLLRTYS